MRQESEESKPRILSLLQSVLHQEEDVHLYCSLCNFEITTIHDRMHIEEKHEHIFPNPGGHIYRLGCFHQAPGCIQAGKFTGQYSWFEGCSWKYALCANCRIHLGWMYRFEARTRSTGSNEIGDVFYGLILTRLVSIKGSSRN